VTGSVSLVGRGFRPLLPALAAVLLAGWFSPEISDPDFWWHLKTGQYIWEKHSLPVPDPFAYTTAMASPAYAGEERTRDLNLTQEWLAHDLPGRLVLGHGPRSRGCAYGFLRPGGPVGVAAVRWLLLGIGGRVRHRRSGFGIRRGPAVPAPAAGSAFTWRIPTIPILKPNRSTRDWWGWDGRGRRPQNPAAHGRARLGGRPDVPHPGALSCRSRRDQLHKATPPVRATSFKRRRW
jgi:hypothetical protein